MCLQCQFSVGLRWAVHRYKIASNWAKNWHRRRMFRLNFVPIRSDPRIIFLSGNQPLREYSNERCTVRAKLLCSASTNCNNYYKNNFIARMYVHLHSNYKAYKAFKTLNFNNLAQIMPQLVTSELVGTNK